MAADAPGTWPCVRFWCWTRARARAGRVRSEDLLAYQSDLYALRKKDGQAYSVGFQCNRLVAIKALFRFLYRRAVLLSDPAAALEVPRVDKRLPRVILTVRRGAAAHGVGRDRNALGLRDRAILETFYATGIRVAELASLNVRDVDTEDRLLRVVWARAGRTATCR